MAVPSDALEVAAEARLRRLRTRFLAAATWDAAGAIGEGAGDGVDEEGGEGAGLRFFDGAIWWWWLLLRSCDELCCCSSCWPRLVRKYNFPSLSSLPLSLPPPPPPSPPSLFFLFKKIHHFEVVGCS